MSSIAAMCKSLEPHLCLFNTGHMGCWGSEWYCSGEVECTGEGCGKMGVLAGKLVGNISYLTDFKEFDRGYVAFGGGAKGGKITGKGTIRTDTECFFMCLDFKLANESHVLLKVPRKNNMYSIDMKNIVPKKDLTCLVLKATNDESMLWHRKLGHTKFKNINKLVKDNNVRGLPSKHFENDQTYVACFKVKQHKVSFKSKIHNSISQPLFM
nr:hypothetical protein [Tanacetum cinerariifolium]